LCLFVYVFQKTSLCSRLTFTCYCSRCSLMLEQLYININMCQPVSVQQTHAIINSTIQAVLPFKNQLKILGSIVTLWLLTLTSSTWFFPLFCKISVKGRAAELKVKTAKKLRSIEISAFEYKLYTNSICLLGRFLDNLPSFQHQIVKERGLLGRAHPLVFEWLCQ